MRRLKKKGFTLVEIMIVVAIIGLLAAIAIPNFMRARQTAQENACQANLKQVEGAKQIWAIDQEATGNDTPSWTDLVDEYLRATPSCPGGGNYTIGAINANATCSVGGNHVMP